MKEKYRPRGIRNSLKEVFETKRRGVAVVMISALTFLLFVLLVSPIYSYQMLTSDPMSFGTVVSTMLADQTLHGYNRIAITGLLAFLVGTVTVSTAISLITNYNSTGSVSTTLGSLIGFASAGCASCGAGVLALMGVTGGASVLPYNGLEVQAFSILILLASMEYVGRQDKICKI